MFFRDPYKDQLIKRIESLIAAGSFEKANNLCLEVLEKDPDDTDMLKLVNLIEQRVQQENEKRIDQVLVDIKPLWEEEKYLEIIQKLNEVKKYSKDYPPLIEAISKAESKYRNLLEERQGEDFKKLQAEFDKFFAKQDLDQVIEKCLEIDNSSLKSKKMEELSEAMKIKVIDVQLDEKKDFLRSDKYDEILNFLSNLKNISPRYQKLLTLIEEIKLRKINNVSAEREETSFQAVDHVKDLLRLGKYEEAYQAAQELLVFNPNSQIAKTLLADAEEKFNQLLHDETAGQIKKSLPKLKEDYQKNKDEYTTL